MVQLKDQMQNALDKARMLILSAQIFPGFHVNSTFAAGFKACTRYWQVLKFIGLCLMIAAARQRLKWLARVT